MKMVSRLFVALLFIVLFVFPAGASHITSSGDPALTGATVIDFESQTLGTYSSLAIGNVTFSANNNHLQIDNTYSGSYGMSGKYLDNGTYSNEGFSSMTMTFAGGTSAFGFIWGAAEESSSWVLNAYNASNVLLDTYGIPSTSSGPGAFVGIAANGISYATLGWTGAYDWVMIDQFSYVAGSSQVPEPTTMILFGLGLIGLAGLRKRD